jgi:hypothetical protein
MRKFASTLAVAATALTIGAMPLPGATPALAQKAKGTCVNKAGEGTGSTVDNAKFQAYEAVLQATDWGMWSQWMASSQKVGVAPGYTVSGIKSKCSAGGLGQVCVVQATLCK